MIRSGTLWDIGDTPPGCQSSTSGTQLSHYLAALSAGTKT